MGVFLEETLFSEIGYSGAQDPEVFCVGYSGAQDHGSFVWVIAGLKTMRSFVGAIAGLKTMRSFTCGRRIRAVGVNPKSVRCKGPCAGVGWTGALGLGETKTQVVVSEDLSQTLIFQLELSP